mgnify:CR=1 FL=1
MPFVLEGVFDDDKPIVAAVSYNLILEIFHSNHANEETFQRFSKLLTMYVHFTFFWLF